MRNFSRYIILLLSIAIVVFLFFTTSTLSDGIIASISDKARRYHSGDLILQAFQLLDGSRLEITDTAYIDRYLNSEQAHIELTTQRSLFLHASQLFFNGQYITQRRINGVDWEAEEKVLSGFTFIAGGLPEPEDLDAILISQAVADFLNINVGDRLILSGRTRGSQLNTQYLLVRGIFNESDFFGYVSYIHRTTLNKFAGRPSGYINEIGIHYKKHTLSTTRNRIQNELWSVINERHNVLPILQSRADRDTQIQANQVDQKVLGIITLAALLSELRELTVAIQLIVFTLLLIFSFLIFIGVSNTFSLMMTERKPEIATMRALGAQRRSVIHIFLLEGLFFTVLGICIGILASLVCLLRLNEISPRLNFPYLSLVLTDNRLVWNVSPSNILLSTILVITASFFGIYFVARKICKESPAQSIH